MAQKLVQRVAGEADCQEALDQGVFSSAVIINILARKRDPQPAAILSIPDALCLTVSATNSPLLSALTERQ